MAYVIHGKPKPRPIASPSPPTTAPESIVSVLPHCLCCAAAISPYLIAAGGICKQCEAEYQVTAPRLGQILRESWDLVNNSKVLKTRLGRCDDILRCAVQLVKFERAGLPTTDPLPSQIAAMIPQKKQSIVEGWVKDQCSVTATLLDGPFTTRQKIAKLQKLYEAVTPYVMMYPGSSEIARLQAGVKRLTMDLMATDAK